MDSPAVRNAYSRLSGRYISLYHGDWQKRDDPTSLVRRHLTGLSGSVLDLGCGPGHWTAYLHSLGVDVIGVDLVPEFIAHARTAHPGPEFRLGSMVEHDLPEHSVAGILAWYSTIHLPPAVLDGVLAAFHRLLRPESMLVVGFFDGEEGDEGAVPFDHAVTTAYRWPVDAFSGHLAAAGFTEVERSRHQLPERPDRRYAAIAARAG